MSNFKYKTKWMSNPQGKPKVYFCCHPDDFDKYFESISNDVLAKQNCVIYYNENNEIVNYEDFFIDLNQMQLFVMPVTAKLLCTKNNALDIEFKFAMENHIPVLPIMQERGLEELFNKKCGELQFLDKHSIDTTAISYDEKLEKYLSSVLIGDELAEKIRASFDAYVFLSYRKKDRKHAQELMHLIHKNDFCRDIAIWYDEFLTPGENFNDSIKEALQKSGLFVLAVTPNLVNEPNYIVSTEYPMAKQEGKPILPAELVPTDEKQLFEKFEDFPGCTNAHNEAELSEALLKTIKKMAIKETDGSPEHKFFIGLAYLSGIDVEVNHERALKLIKSAAESGLLTAYEKLVSMYRTGLGVEIDYFEAIMWQLDYAEICYTIYDSNPTVETLTNVIIVYMNLGDYYRELNMFDDAEEAYSTMLSAAKSLVSQDDSYSNKELLSDSLNRFFLLMQDTKQFSKSEEYIEQVLQIDNELYEDDNKIKGIHYGNAGVAYTESMNFPKAQECFKKSVDILSKTSNNDADTKGSLSLTYNNWGMIFFKRCDYKTSIIHFEEAIRFVCESNEETNNSYLEEYALFNFNLANAKNELLEFDDAKKALKESYAIYKELFEEQGLPQYLGRIAACQNLIGLLYYYQKKIDLAKKYYCKSLETYLCWDEEFAELYKADIALVRNNLATVFLEEKEYTSAYLGFERALKALNELKVKEQAYIFNYALISYNISTCLYHLKDFKKAELYAMESFNIYRKFLGNGYVKQYQNTAAQIFVIQIRQGHIIKALKFLRNVICKY